MVGVAEIEIVVVVVVAAALVYHDNIFMKRSKPTVRFAHRGINHFDKIDLHAIQF